MLANMTVFPSWAFAAAFVMTSEGVCASGPGVLSALMVVPAPGTPTLRASGFGLAGSPFAALACCWGW